LKKRIKASKLEEWREIPTDPSKIKVKESQGQVKTRYYE
jgi:hypothetical protein